MFEKNTIQASAGTTSGNGNCSGGGACDNEWCRAALRCAAGEAAALRRELSRAREQRRGRRRPWPRGCAGRGRAGAAPTSPSGGARLAAACAALSERAAHLQRALSAETRVKLDLLQALGDAKRHMHIQEGLISRQDKEMEELKAQMLAVMPTEFVAPTGGVSKLRLSDGSPLDPTLPSTPPNNYARTPKHTSEQVDRLIWFAVEFHSP
ncbi:hypothetical protein MSG28_012991 [Choristoneura fumiferana]|uniref:Uncharacterized protein n=1 Tax=Choristoneura fumiferana TaxID=7141 RepID=A0ACC0KS72_CHOFU|nr:hypothetical protein MSG28_012991 [Choristoneura fumiferana]